MLPTQRDEIDEEKSSNHFSFIYHSPSSHLQLPILTSQKKQIMSLSLVSAWHFWKLAQQRSSSEWKSLSLAALYQQTKRKSVVKSAGKLPIDKSTFPQQIGALRDQTNLFDSKRYLPIVGARERRLQQSWSSCGSVKSQREKKSERKQRWRIWNLSNRWWFFFCCILNFSLFAAT